MTVEALQKMYGLDGRIEVELGQGNRPVITLQHAMGHASVDLFGAHVLSYVPAGCDDLLWLSPKAEYQLGRAIRGGIPIIWPWFGAHATDHSLPSHGFARTNEWELVGSGADSHSTWIMLRLPSSAADDNHFYQAYELTVRITVGESLDVVLTTENRSQQEMVVTQALHTYFAVGAIEAVSVERLDGVDYIDTVGERTHHQQSGSIRFDREVDRIYTGVPPQIDIIDTALARTIKIHSTGSRSAVVWNPWIDKSERLGDFPDNGYKTMVCVETANVASDQCTLGPGERTMLGASISATLHPQIQ